MNNARKKRTLVPFLAEGAAAVGVFVVVQNHAGDVGVKRQLINVFLAPHAVCAQLGDFPRDGNLGDIVVQFLNTAAGVLVFLVCPIVSLAPSAPR